MTHPRVDVTDIEYRLGTRFTAETVQALQALYPGVRFVWLMGADNFATFHLWDNWEWIIENVPLGILARPGQRISARMSRAADHYAHDRLPGRHAARLSRGDPPRWCFVNIPLDSSSSSEIRARGDWNG